MSLKNCLGAGCLISVLGLMGCGDDDDPSVMIDSPSTGDTFSSAEDADPAMDGIQVDVSVVVDNESEGEEVWLYSDATALTDTPDATPTLVETLPADGRVTFRPTLEPGTHALLACVRDCRFRSQQVTVTVVAGCAGVAFINPTPEPGDFTNLGPADDVDGEACGATFTTSVRLTTTASDGASFQLVVNGSPGPTATSAGGQVTFSNVVLGERGSVPNTLSVRVSESGGASCMQDYPNSILVDCDGTSCRISQPSVMRSILNASDDVSAADGFQADFEVTGGADAVGQTFNLVVDGESLEAVSTASGGVAIAQYNAIDLTEGRHSVFAECFDAAGIETRTEAAIWTVDTVGCEITVEEPLADTLFIDADDVDAATDGVQVNTSGTVSGDACTGVTAGVCGSTGADLDLTGSTFSGNATLASSPMQELCVTVSDDAGNETEARVAVRLRTNAPQLQLVSPTAGTAYNQDGTGGATADLDTGTPACDIAATVNCTELGSTVELRDSVGDTTLATSTCVAMGGLPAPFTGQATFASAVVPSRNDGRQVAAWDTSSGAPSATRWPTLTRLGWLLPLSPPGEITLAAGEAVGHHWDLCYRGLIPRALARRLGPLPAGQVQPEEADA